MSRNKKSGFTLIETLMAITIITYSVLGPLAMAAYASRLMSVAKSQLTAVYLAQEGLEIIRHAKDSNLVTRSKDPLLTDAFWLGGIDAPETSLPYYSLSNCFWNNDSAVPESGPEEVCYLDGTTIGQCGSPDSCSNKYLYFSEGSGYTYSNIGTERTTFKRFARIKTLPVGPGNEEDAAMVRIKVSWSDSFGPKTIYLQETMYNYR